MTSYYRPRLNIGDTDNDRDTYEGPPPTPVDPHAVKVAELVASITRFDSVEKEVRVWIPGTKRFENRDRVVYTFELYSRHPLTLKSDAVPAVSVTYRTNPSLGHSECFTLPFASEVRLEPRQFGAQFVPKSLERDVDCMMPRGVTELHIGHRVIRFRDGWRVRPE